MTSGPGIARTPLPKGFLASGLNSGVRKYRPDLGVLLSDRDCAAAGVFTLSQCKAAPILYCQDLLPSNRIRAIITNSGQANAATGKEGLSRNLKMVERLSDLAGCKADQVLSASTGVIGVQLDLDKILPTIPELLSRATEIAEPFALAILTTDLVPKTVMTDLKLSGGTVRLTGICKGSGMIHPNMGTMLGYLLTDAVMDATLADSMLRTANDESFNMISVDGDTSTNDAVFMLANGASGVALKTVEDKKLFAAALLETCIALAKSIARDGEGATKLIEVRIKGAPSRELARKAARGITLSPLIKTAMHGEDPNWGRVLARLGAEDVPAECLEKMVLTIQGLTLFQDGAPLPFDKAEARKSLRSSTIQIDVDLRSGTHAATAWGCDFSKKYVEINGEYTT